MGNENIPGSEYHLYRYLELTNLEAGTVDDEFGQYEWAMSGVWGYKNPATEDIIQIQEGELSDRLYEHWLDSYNLKDQDLVMGAEVWLRDTLMAQFFQVEWFKAFQRSTVGFMPKSDYDFTRGTGSYYTVPKDLLQALRGNQFLDQHDEELVG
tara:strand:- start:491 stop:949 length:459 start_codon:yes stop_codon:yes gene_type:complete